MTENRPAYTSEGLALLRDNVRGDLSRLTAVLIKHRVLLLVLYRSNTKGKSVRSNLEMAALFEGGELGWERIHPKAALETDLCRALNLTTEFSILSLNIATDSLQVRVVHRGIPVYEREPGSWVWYSIKARRRYEDVRRIGLRQLRNRARARQEAHSTVTEETRSDSVN